MPWTVDEKRVLSRDGTAIACQAVGAGPVLLLASGLVGSRGVWKHLHAFLSDRVRMVSWDYRGLYGSATPGDLSRLRVEDHVDDALAVLDGEGAASAILVGWSMGVQINFEIYRRAPERVRAIVAICGTYGRPFETLFNWKASGTIIPVAAVALSDRPAAVSWLGRRIASWPALIALARLAGLVGPGLDEEAFLALAGDFGGLDPRMFGAVAREMGRHDATDLLTSVGVPVLIIAGSADVLIPSRVAEKMARRIPGAELTIVPGGTSFVPLEHPELVNLRIEKFLCDHGLLEAGSRASRRPLRAGTTHGAATKEEPR